MKTIAFHDNNLCLRGTSVALYDYADYNEKILGNKSIILSSQRGNLDALDKFKNRFETHLMDFYAYQDFCNKNKVDYLYIIKSGGKSDGLCLVETPTLIHSVFCVNEPHGHKYFYVSDWLAKNQGYNPDTHSLPHIVTNLPSPKYNLREKLNIPKNNKVFGCYAGSTEFNINFVHDAIRRTVEERDDIVFIFMNINKFHEHKNIIYLPGSWDMGEKSSFIHACDAMIHARSGGETFGCAVAEFSVENKPVITYGLSGERSHLELLGDRAIIYNSYDEVYNIFNNIDDYILYDDYYKCYDNNKPEVIMDKFEKKFLN
jgi:hypothetical protein